MIDEAGLDLIGRVVVDDDIHGCPLRDAVVRARNRVIDEGQKRLRRAVTDAFGVELSQIDIE